MIEIIVDMALIFGALSFVVLALVLVSVGISTILKE